MISDYYETANYANKTLVSDGMGGFVPSYSLGVEFPALIQRAGTAEQAVATQKGLSEAFIVFCPANINLNYNDTIVFKNKYYRLTSEELDPPKTATFSDHQYKAISIEVV